MAEAKALSEAKLRRRIAKAALTRISKTLRIKLQNDRPPGEITEALQKVKQACNDLIVKHEEYAQNIENDENFETEEKWLEESQNAYLQLECTTNYSIMNKKLTSNRHWAEVLNNRKRVVEITELKPKRTLNSRKQSEKLRQLNSKLQMSITKKKLLGIMLNRVIMSKKMFNKAPQHSLDSKWKDARCRDLLEWRRPRLRHISG
jgi:hypothetical protein